MKNFGIVKTIGKVGGFTKNIFTGTADAVGSVFSVTGNALKNVSEKTKNMTSKVSGNPAFFMDDSQFNNGFGKVSLLVLLVFSWFVLDSIYNYISYVSNLSFSNIAGLPLALVSFGVILFLAYYLIRDIMGVVTLSRQQTFRNKIVKLIKANKVERLKEALLEHKLTSLTQRKKLIEKYKTLDTTREVVVAYEEVVLKKVDKEVNNVITKYALLSSGANVLSNKAFFDFVITFMLFSKMVINIAQIYNIKLGICSFTKIMAAGLMGASFTTLTTKLIGSILRNVPIINTIGEIAIPGLVIRQLGLKIKYALRPIRAVDSSVSKNDMEELEKEITDFSKGLSKEMPKAVKC